MEVIFGENAKYCCQEPNMQRNLMSEKDYLTSLKVQSNIVLIF